MKFVEVDDCECGGLGVGLGDYGKGLALRARTREVERPL